jgi:hypothetical protein
MYNNNKYYYYYYYYYYYNKWYYYCGYSIQTTDCANFTIVRKLMGILSQLQVQNIKIKINKNT